MSARPSEDEWEADLVSVITDRRRYPPKLEDAPGLFRPLGETSRREPVPEVLILVGGRAPAIPGFEVRYELDEHSAWRFSQADLFVLTPNIASTLRDLERRIIAKLGKAAWRRRTERDNDSRTTAWKLGRGIEVWLERVKSPLPGETIPRDHIHISIARPAGEGE